MKSFLRMMPVALVLFVLPSCSSDDFETVTADDELSAKGISPEILRAFEALFTDATDVAWDTTGDYAVASFSTADSDTRSTAWFGKDDYQCKMERQDEAFANLPEAVRTAFLTSEFSTWELDEKVDFFTRHTSGAVQEICVVTASATLDGHKAKAKLYYTTDGVLLKAVVTIIYTDNGDDDRYDDLVMQTPPDYVNEFVLSHYPQAKYVGIYREGGLTVVKLLDGRNVRRVSFDSAGAWISTTTEMKLSDVPDVVRQAFSQSAYSDMKVKEIVETATPDAETVYIWRLEDKKAGEVEVKITASGIILGGDSATTSPDDPVSEPQGIDAFIASHYPGAVVTKRDTDQKETEIELTYDGVKISVKFSMPSETWLQSEWKLSWSKGTYITEAVQTTVKTSYSAYSVEYVSLIETSEGRSWYEIGLRSSGHKNSRTVLLNADGSVIAEYGK